MKKTNAFILAGVGAVSAVIVVFTAKTSATTIKHLSTVINTVVSTVGDVVKTAIEHFADKKDE